MICSCMLAGRAYGETVDLSSTPKVEDGLTASKTGTDTLTAGRESEAMSSQQRKARAGAQQFEFQAEVSRLMDIIINSLYSNKDIFLRELISNASDALDKIRFLALTDKGLLGEGETAELEIKMSIDKDNKILYIRDRGIGMTKEDLIKNLGTIAKSGTAAFLEQMQKGGDMNLIGQFGLGFYSVYLVADTVEVITKHNDDKQYIWESNAQGSFSIVEDTENEPLGRGTLIKIHLKDEAMEYLEEHKLRELVGKYSEFINFPIYLLTEKEVEVPVEDDAAEEADASTEDKADEADAKDESEEEEKEDEKEDKTEEGEVEDDDEEEEDEDKDGDKKKTRKEKRKEWDRLNDNKAIWLRTPSDVTKEEYQKFYKAVSKDYGEALTYTHFKAEGDVEFKAVLYIPETAPYDFYDKYYEKSPAGLKLYVRRVFISDDFTELIPRYLAFLRGLVDSDTLPLNVSREMLQQHASLKTIKKKLVRKVLDMIKKMADNEVKCKKADKEDADKEEKAAEKPTEEECGQYEKFWKQYGKSIKLGVMEDSANRNRLSKLLRFHTSASPDKLTTLEEYVERMKDGQKQIYFLAGTSQAELEKSPFLERLLKKGYEVIYWTDVLDEYLMQHLLEFEDKKFANASKEDLKLADKDEKERKRDKELKEEFKDLAKWWKNLLGDKVSGVKVSNRLTTTPCVVVTSKFGNSANMERIMRAQAFSDPSRASFMKGQRSLEINPRHPLVKALKSKVDADEKAADAESVAQLLFETALLESGFELDDAKSFSSRMYEVLKDQIGYQGSLEDIEQESEEVEEEVEEAAEAEGKEGEESKEEDEDEEVKDEL